MGSVSRRAGITALVLASLALAGFLAQRARAPGGAGRGAPGTMRYAIPDGARLDYSLEGASVARIDMASIPADPRQPSAGAAGGGVATVETAFTSTLRLKLFADGNGGWNVAAWLDAPRVTTNREEPGWAWAVSHPFSFHLGSRGTVGEVAVTPLLPAEARAFVSRLAAGLQAVLPDEMADVWTVTQVGPDGEAEVAYKRTSWDPTTGALGATRQVRRQVRTSAGAAAVPFLDGLRVDVVASSGTVRTTLAAWITRLEAEEEVAFLSGQSTWARSGSRLVVNALAPGADVFPERFTDFQAIMRSQRFVAAALSRTDPELDRASAGLDTSGALARYLELRKSDQRAAERFLVNYLRMRPAAPAELLRAIDRDSRMQRLDERTQLTLWRLVVEAGSPAAQRAILEAATDPTYHHGSHVRAMLYAIDFQNPQPFLVEGMMTLHRDPSAVSRGDTLGAARNMSLLAVGSLGSREKLDEETRAAAARALIENLALSARDPAEAALTLKSIGNTGNDALLETVQPAFNSPDERVRAAAFEALRRMEAPAAQDRLLAAYRDEASLPVREAGLRALAEMPLTPATLAWAREAVLAARSLSETVLLVELLGRSLRANPENAEALRALLATNPPVSVKETVYKFITPA